MGGAWKDRKCAGSSQPAVNVTSKAQRWGPHTPHRGKLMHLGDGDCSACGRHVGVTLAGTATAHLAPKDRAK